MTEDTKPSAESLALASLFGAVLSGIATELKVANFNRGPEISAALRGGLRRASENRNVPASAEWRAAVLSEMQKTAGI